MLSGLPVGRLALTDLATITCFPTQSLPGPTFGWAAMRGTQPGVHCMSQPRVSRGRAGVRSLGPNTTSTPSGLVSAYITNFSTLNVLI